MPQLYAKRIWCTAWAAAFATIALHAQKSPAAQAMERSGFVDIREVDSTIQVSLMYAQADNFTGKVLYNDLREAYLHPKAAQALAKAQHLLKTSHPELSLKVFDAARPMHIQQKMWDTVAGTPKNIYVSNPKNGGGLHNYGLAVDVSILDADGQPLDMGTPVDHLGPEANIGQEAQLVSQGKLTEDARQNRLLLRHVMRQAGFRALPSEWWHFNLVSRQTARNHYPVIP